MAPEIEELYRYDKDLQVSRYLQQRDELMDELDSLSIPSPPKGQMIPGSFTGESSYGPCMGTQFEGT